MKKTQQKIKQSPKTKIQLKIKSKNVTNNFILTPRTPSAIDQKDNFHRLDKFTEQIKSQRQKREQAGVSKTSKQGKKPQYRVVFTDHTKSIHKKRVDDDQTGTHTPLLKRVSFTSDIGIKKKSTHSLASAERSKQRKKDSSKLSNSTSSEINKATLQRLIGVIIKDYKDGKLKQKQLQQTLMELYDHKQKRRSVGKGKKKKNNTLSAFSNQFIKSTHQIKSEALVRKRKRSDQIQQSVLQRKGFVNKIIIKGITTSLFLKEDPQLSNPKQNDTKSRIQQNSYQINTSNSIKQIFEDMIMVKQNINKKPNIKFTLQQKMAIKIQRAWRRYRTRKILCQISKKKKKKMQINQPFHILDEFTDEQNDQPYESNRFTRNIVRSQDFQTESKQYSALVNLISDSLHEKKLSKQECLKKILKFLKYPPQLLQVSEQQEKDDHAILQNAQDLSIIVPPAQNQQQGKQSRVIIFNKQINFQQKQQYFQQSQSNELNSFTNKYSSKEVNKDNKQYFTPEQQVVSELDESLTFVHSQTSANQSFKMINISNIEEGLKSRQDSLLIRKEKELQELTERFFANKLSKNQYQQQRQKLEKWFKSKQKQLKKIKNSLMKSCKQAKNLLQNDSGLISTDKSKKMLKCLSDKYIKKQDWLLKQENNNKQKTPIQHLECQENEYDSIRSTKYGQKQQIQQQNDRKLIFNKKDKFEVEWQEPKCYQISPKLSRHTSLQQNQYKYEQIEGNIQQDDEVFQQGMGKIQNKQLQSDKFIKLNNKIDEVEISAQQISLINNYVNQTTKRFKYLCTEDKQDIFQFLFLDLVLEMFTQLYPGQSKILRAAEIYINRAKRLKKIPKGIKTNLIACKQYLKILQQFVTKQPNSLKGLSLPMGPSAAEMLRYMRDEIVQNDQDDNITSTLVLPVQVFQKLGKTKQLQLKLERYYDDDQKQIARVSFLRTALHINNKALFDSLNQMLDHQRPYGVWGKPFPWKKALSMDKKWTKIEQQTKFKSSIDKTIQCCSYLCGILVDKQDSLFGSHRVSEEYIMQIREDRLSKMLANDLIQNEERWIFYDDEQTEILMETSAYITKKIIKQLVLQLVTFRMKF